MKYFIVIFISIFVSNIFCQTTADITQQCRRTQLNGMYALSGFAVSNIAVSTFSLGGSNNANQSFHQMNIGWNGVNLILGASGIWQQCKNKPATNLQEAIKQSIKTEKIFLTNAALDVAYIIGGFYVRETRYRQPEQWNQRTGWGNAIIYNGSFLLLFDGVMYAINRKYTNKLLSATRGIQIGFSNNSIHTVVKF
jgi:hypothetical protein